MDEYFLDNLLDGFFFFQNQIISSMIHTGSLDAFKSTSLVKMWLFKGRIFFFFFGSVKKKDFWAL